MHVPKAGFRGAFRAGALSAVLLAVLGCAPDSPAGQGLDPKVLEQEFSEILREPDLLDRLGRLTGRLQELPPGAVEPVRRAYDRAFLEYGDVELVPLVEWWASFEPEQAYEWSRSDWRGDHPRIEPHAIRAIARQNPQTALELVLARYPSAIAKRRSVVDGLILGWFQSGQAGLVDFVASQATLEDRQHAMGTLTRIRVARDGAEATLAWINGLEAPEPFRKELRLRMLAAVSRMDSPFAARWAEGDEALETYGEARFRHVALIWAMKDPLAAITWVSQLPEAQGPDVGFDVHTAVDAIMKRWAKRDLPAAESWLRKQLAESDEPRPWLDRAIRGVVVKQLREEANPPTHVWQERAALANQVASSSFRLALLARVGQAWHRHDPSAVEEWLADKHPEMPEHQLKAIRSAKPAPGPGHS